MTELLSRWSTIVASSKDDKAWREKHDYVTKCLSEGWILQASHAVTDGSALIVYFFLVKPK